jgi:hypothetical protein
MLESWLEPRLAGTPRELAVAIRQLVRELDPADPAGAALEAAGVPERLASAALRGFEDVLAETAADLRSRSAALRLLAADASLTYAFEAAADLELDVVALADRVGPRGTLGTLLEAAAGVDERGAGRGPRAGGETS